MQNMPPMLAYTLRGSTASGVAPLLIVGIGPQAARFTPANPQDDSYWFLFLDRNNPKNKVADFLVPGQNNTTIPPNVDQYMGLVVRNSSLSAGLKLWLRCHENKLVCSRGHC